MWYHICLLWPAFIWRIFLRMKIQLHLFKTMWWIRFAYKMQISSNYNVQFCFPFITFFLVMCFRQLLLCRVTLGKSFLQFNAMKMAHAPPGHHSVVGRPSVGGLSFPEYVVYRGEQVKLLHLMSSFKVSWSRACWE